MMGSRTNATGREPDPSRSKEKVDGEVGNKQMELQRILEQDERELKASGMHAAPLSG